MGRRAPAERPAPGAVRTPWPEGSRETALPWAFRAPRLRIPLPLPTNAGWMREDGWDRRVQWRPPDAEAFTAAVCRGLRGLPLRAGARNRGLVRLGGEARACLVCGGGSELARDLASNRWCFAAAKVRTCCDDLGTGDVV